MTLGSAWIVGIDFGINQPVEPHRRAPGADHGDTDPENLADPRGFVTGQRRQYHPHQCEWKSKNRMGELDHLQQGCNFFKNLSFIHATSFLIDVESKRIIYTQ